MGTTYFSREGHEEDLLWEFSSCPFMSQSSWFHEYLHYLTNCNWCNGISRSNHAHLSPVNPLCVPSRWSMVDYIQPTVTSVVAVVASPIHT